MKIEIRIQQREIMNKSLLKLQRALTTLLITGISVFALAPAHAADAPKVTAFNYVRAETDVQMNGYIASYDSFGKFAHSGSPTTLTTR